MCPIVWEREEPLIVNVKQALLRVLGQLSSIGPLRCNNPTLKMKTALSLRDKAVSKIHTAKAKGIQLNSSEMESTVSVMLVCLTANPQ